MKKDGFTLLEVILFMAISSSLALIAFASMGPRLRNVRFTDSMRGVESSFNKAVADSRSGVNSNLADTECVATNQPLIKFTVKKKENAKQGSSPACVMNGIWAYFDKDKITYYQVAALKDRVCEADKVIDSAGRIVECFGARPVGLEIPGLNIGEEQKAIAEYKLTNGLEQTSAPTFVGYVLNPENNEPFLFLENPDSSNTKKICYSLGGRIARVQFTTTSLEPKLEFNEGGCT